MPQSRSQRGQVSRKLRVDGVFQKSLTDSESVQSQGRPPSRSRLLKRKKSSDSVSTGTTSEDTYGCAVAKLRDHDASSGTRPVIAPRRSRPKLDDYRPSRPGRELLSREVGKKITHGSNGEPSRRENPFDVVGQSGRDKGKAVDRSAHTPSTWRPLPEPPKSATSEPRDKRISCGQSTYVDYEKEIDHWKKLAKKQAKKIEELKAQVLAETLIKKEQEMQVQTLKGKMEKKEELIMTIETALQCQICMDLIYQPYALSPCGHMLCLQCLQEWFRKAPPVPEDDDIDDESNYILKRTKSCPCCRTVVTQRPIPVFVVKAIATVLSKHRAAAEPGVSRLNRSPTPGNEDPWEGLFHSADDNDVDSVEASDEDDAYQDAIGWAVQGLQIGFHGELGHQFLGAFEEDVESDIGSEFEVSEGLEMEDEDSGDDGDGDSSNSYEFDEYESVYIPARWEPPSVMVDPEMYVFRSQGVAASILRMLRRGCTVDMIRLFEITYSHDRGLVAHLPSLDNDFVESSHIVIPRYNRVFLGWNVHLDGEDYTGELYMRRVLIDMRESPEKWLWTERTNFPGAFDVKLSVRIEEVEHYDTTDTEDWLAHDPYD